MSNNRFNQGRTINTSCHHTDLESVMLKHYFSYLFVLPLLLFMAATTESAQENQSHYKISSPVSGVVKQVYVKTQQIVKYDELLLEFDSTLVDSDIKQAKALKTLAIVSLSEAKKELQRAKELYERTVLSDHDLQKAGISYNEKLVQLSSADKQLTHALWNKKYSSVRAPFDAKIIKVFAYQGQYINNKLQVQTLFLLEKIP